MDNTRSTRTYHGKIQVKKNTANLVDWFICGKVHKQSSKNYQRFISRYEHKRLEVNAAKYNIATTIKQCPYCLIDEETTDHFLLCNQNPESWASQIPMLQMQYNKYKVYPALRLLINMAIKNDLIKTTKQTNPLIQ